MEQRKKATITPSKAYRHTQREGMFIVLREIQLRHIGCVSDNECALSLLTEVGVFWTKQKTQIVQEGQPSLRTHNAPPPPFSKHLLLDWRIERKEVTMTKAGRETKQIPSERDRDSVCLSVSLRVMRLSVCL